MKQMIAKLLLASVLVFVACTTDADEDVDTFDASVVCPAEGLNKYGMPNRGTFIDERDGQEYKYTTIGDQVWMAQNLNYDAEYSKCYDNDPANCDVYGRLYALQKDGKQGGKLDSNLVSSVCPSGWHLPRKKEWEIMVNSVGGFDEEKAADRLKTVYGWENTRWGNGIDVCSFSVFPSGSFYAGSFQELKIRTGFWTTTLETETLFYKIAVDAIVADVKDSRFDSIRCLRD